MKDTPASTLLHLGPGLANGLANIHNARRASSGMVNIVGEHSAAHLKYDPPLTSDIEGLARPLSHWVRRAESPRTVAWDAATAVAKASEHPGQIATLILPGDTSWQEAGRAGRAAARRCATAKAPDAARIEHIAQVLRSGEPTLLILASKATRGRALELAGKLNGGDRLPAGARSSSPRASSAARAACRWSAFPMQSDRPSTFLNGFKHIITVETSEPIAFFSYPDKPSLLKAAGTSVHPLVEIGEDSELRASRCWSRRSARRARAAVFQPRIETPRRRPARSNPPASPMRWPPRCRKTASSSMNR